jgi:hypothetical protein
MKPKRMFAAINVKSPAYMLYIRPTAGECRRDFQFHDWKFWFRKGWRVVPVIVTLERVRKK